MDLDSLSTFSEFASVGAFALICGVLAGLRERRERRRRDLDRISAVPWQFISALCSMLAIICLATAAKVYFAGG
ncbi:hypothetical protein NSE01_06560 [Novosphingobium sediminis]|uniref:Uncharacterized protein n=1 Tax=Novosphingobium sediminis TaxID=707214 RepID=A0A512AGK5_9SPHN|nr:hypothetical protein [Novosphingobium sediminis]GEN98823.1 hypothetical protein NSE01_06560 [Novosphingobium sediminis]